MGKNKKVFALLTLVCFLFTLMPVAVFAGSDGIDQTQLSSQNLTKNTTRNNMSLTTPTGLTWVDNKGTISWNPVAGAKGYDVHVFCDGWFVGNKQPDSGTTLTIADLINDAGSYTFRVIAHDGNNNRSDVSGLSDIYVYNRPAQALTTPTSVSWQGIVPSWKPSSPSEDLQYYAMHYYNTTASSIGWHNSGLVQNDGYVHENISFLANRLTMHYPDANVVFSVRATSKDITKIANSEEVFSTNAINTADLKKDAPTNVEWANYNEGIICWNGPKDSSGYELVIRKNGDQIGRMDFGSNLRPNADGKYYVYVGNLINDDGDYTVDIKARGNGQTTIDSVYAASNVFRYERPSKELPTPNKGEWRDNFASWNAIEDNSLSGYMKGYMVQYSRNGNRFSYDAVDCLNNDDRGYIIHDNGSMFAKYCVNKNSNDDYTFTVQANSNNLLEVANSRPSDSSNALNESEFRGKLSAPTGLEIVKNNGEYAVLFYPVANTNRDASKMYHLTVSRDGNVIFDNERGWSRSTLPSKIGMSLTDLITEYGTYTVKVRANGDNGYSTDSEYATITYVNQRPSSGGGSVGGGSSSTNTETNTTTSPDGTKVETTTETKADGTTIKTTTTTAANGETSTTVTTTLKNGSSVSNADSSVNIQLTTVDKDVVKDAEKAVKADEAVEVIGDEENTVKITAENKVSGDKQETFVQPVKVSVVVDSKVLKKVEDTSKLTLAKVVTNEDGTTKLIYLGGSYDETTGTFNAKVDEAGDYILVEKADLVKIELNIDKKDVKHNDKGGKLDVAPKINGKDGRTELPLRYLGEALGFDIEWNNNVVTIIKGNISFNLTIGQEVPGFGTPYIDSDRTMVSARYISEKLGAKVIWDPIERQVTVVK